MPVFLIAALISAEKTWSDRPPERHKKGAYVLTAASIDYQVWLETQLKYKEPHTEKESRDGVAGIRPMPEKKPTTFQVVVPKSYDRGKRHGLLVYVSANDSGAFPAGYHPLLEKHQLIAVGANQSGNGVEPVIRHALAVTSVKLLSQLYNLDPERIYITGTSGGGRLASQAMIMHGNLFTGGIPMVGANPCLPMQNAASDGTYYKDPGTWKNPNQKILALTQARSRLVFYTGSNDFNRLNAQAVAQGYLKLGFRYVLYLEEPNHGHTNASPEWFEKAITFVDAPLAEASEKVFQQAMKAAANDNVPVAYQRFAKVARHGRGKPYYQEAQTKAASYRKQLDDQSIQAFQKIQEKKRPTQAKLRKFIAQWQGFSGADQAKEAMNEWAVKELEKIKRKRGAGARVSLMRFLKKWSESSAYSDAIERLDELAAKELTTIQKVKKTQVRHAKLMRFIKMWSPAPSTRKAQEQLNTEAAEILGQIETIPNQAEQFQKMQAFVRAYKNTEPGQKLIQQIKDMQANSKK